MLTAQERDAARERAATLLREAGIALTRSEAAEIEVADFGLSRLEETGLEVVVYVNTDRVCAKELVMFPRQLCPEHRHPPFDGTPGQGGDLPLPQRASSTSTPRASRRARPAARVPADGVFTVWHEIVLAPRRAAHDHAEHAPLVPGRRRGGDRVGVLDAEHRRARRLHRPADPARDADRRLSSAPVLCVGVLVADVFVPPLARLPDSRASCSPPTTSWSSPGGCAANVAVALRRLGVAASVSGRVGDDLFGELVERELSALRDRHERGADDAGARDLEDGDRRGRRRGPPLPAHLRRERGAGCRGHRSLRRSRRPRSIYVGGYLILPALREDELARAPGGRARPRRDDHPRRRRPGRTRTVARSGEPPAAARRLLRPQPRRGARPDRRVGPAPAGRQAGRARRADRR